MTFKPFVLLCSCVSVFTWMLAKADSPGFRLVRQDGTDQINPIRSNLNMKWSHGAYIAMDWTAAQPPVFYTVDRDGAWTETARFQNPEPTRFYTSTYDRQSNGTIVFSGQTESAPRVVSPYLAWTSADGKVQRMVRTDNYFAYELAVAPDDTIWTLGYEMVNLDPNDPAVKEAHVLRHFDEKGNLIASAFPQSQFDSYGRFRISQGLLAVTGDRLGWYGPRFGKAAYIEISFLTMTMKEYPGASSNVPKDDDAGALAMTNSGVVSVSVGGGSPRARRIFILDRTSSTWVPVSVPPAAGLKITPGLIGNDGDNLVFRDGGGAGFFSVLQQDRNSNF